MPLSKERDRERKRRERAIKRVQPNPMLPDWVVQPNVYLQAHMKYCPDYDPVQPKFDHYINPLLRGQQPLPNSPDGRYREYYN